LRFESLETRELLSVTAGIVPSAGSDETASYVASAAVTVDTDRGVSAAASVGNVGGDTGDSGEEAALPTVTGITPGVGPIAGGTTVNLMGTGFTGATAMNFGNTPAASFTVVSDTLITAISPAGSAGLVDLTVVGPDGTSTTSAADCFTFYSTTTLVAQEDYACFGNLNQHSLDTSYPHLGTGDHNMACGPCSATNSLVYLENAFPDTYGTSLIASAGHDMDDDGSYTAYDDWIFTAGGCLATSNYMNTTQKDGTYEDTYMWGLRTWIEQQASGKTVYSAQEQSASSNWGDSPAPDSPPSWVQDQTPTWDFIYDGLNNSSAVCMMLQYTNGGGHFMSIMGITWDTSSSSGTLQYMDPWVGKSGAVGINESNGTFYLDYNGTDASYFLEILVLAPLPDPTVTALSATSGPDSGGTAVTITGTGFTNATAVDFGTVAATNFTVVSDTEITATSPAGTPGTVDVTVTTPAGTSADSDVDDFTYQAPLGATVGGYDPSTSNFFLRNSNTTGYADNSFGFGWTPDSGSDELIPLAGDWTGQGYDTVGLYDPSTSTFYLSAANSTGVAQTSFGFGWVPDAGQPALVPLVGDWTGQKSDAGYAIDTIGLYDPATSFFYLRNSNTAGAADITAAFGTPGMVPVVGDWQGNGTTTIGAMDPATSGFYLAGSNATGHAALSFGYGAPNANWIPLAGDWTAQGFDTVGLYDPTTGQYHLRNSNTAGLADIVVAFGVANWSPITGVWSAPEQQPTSGDSNATNLRLPPLAGGQGQPFPVATSADSATTSTPSATDMPASTARPTQVASGAANRHAIDLESSSQDDPSIVESTLDDNAGLTFDLGTPVAATAAWL
jgi:hypothetical protein